MSRGPHDDAYLDAADIAGQKKTPLFRSIGTRRRPTDRPMYRNDALRMIKRRAKAAGLSEETWCHTFRATGITAYLECGGTIEKVQAIAFHESPKTTKLYDRTSDQVDLDEIEKIRILEVAPIPNRHCGGALIVHGMWTRLPRHLRGKAQPSANDRLYDSSGKGPVSFPSDAVHEPFGSRP